MIVCMILLFDGLRIGVCCGWLVFSLVVVCWVLCGVVSSVGVVCLLGILGDLLLLGCLIWMVSALFDCCVGDVGWCFWVD